MAKARNISFIDLSLKKPDFDKTLNGISKLISKKNFIGGDEVRKFEDNFSKFNDSKYCAILEENLKSGIKFKLPRDQ